MVVADVLDLAGASRRWWRSVLNAMAMQQAERERFGDGDVKMFVICQYRLE